MIKNKSCSKGRALRIAVGTTLAILLLFGSAAADALSNSGGGSWLYYKDIIISNIDGPLTDYQVLLNLAGGNFPTNASGSGADIRFTNESGSELSYWIENWDYTGRTARIWVKMPNMPIAPSSLRMHYGNPSALSSSNGDTTFDFFDDFNDNIIDTTKWTKVYTMYDAETSTPSNIKVDEVGGQFRVYGTQNLNYHYGRALKTNTQFTSPLIIEYDKISLIGADVNAFMFVNDGAKTWGLWQSTQNNQGWRIGQMGGIEVPVSPLNRDYPNKQSAKVVLYEGGQAKLYVKDTAGNIYSGAYNTISPTTFNIFLGGNPRAVGNTINAYFDNFRVRKYASIEPSVSVGQEISIPILKSIAVSPSSTSILAGNAQTFTATPKDQFGNPINATVTWSSSNTSVGTIDPDTGAFTAKAAGTAVVTATNGSASGSASVTVTHNFRFVQLTDVHIGPDLISCGKGALKGLEGGVVGAFASGAVACVESYAESISRFINVRNHILKSNKPNFVLITGDLVEWNTVTQYPVFTNLISKFNEGNINVYVVPGNHDRRGQDYPIPNPFFPSDDLNNYKIYIGDGNKYDMKDNYFNQDTYRFIGLDSGSDTGFTKSIKEKDIEQLYNFLMYPNGSGLSKNDQKNQMEFLKRTMIEGKTIIFMHHPAIDDSCKNNSCNVIYENRELFVGMTREKHAKLILTGHTHEAKFFNADGYKIPASGRDTVSPLFIQTRSATKEFPLGYLIVDADEKGEHIEERLITASLSDYIIAFLASPADQHVYDESGRHTGINITGGVENSIPDSYYFENLSIGNITLPAFVLLYNTSLNYRFEIVANFSRENIIEPQSSFNFTIMRRGINATSTISYNNVSINRDSRAYLQINSSQTNYAMGIDMNNDGAIDTIQQPDAVETDSAPIANILSPADGSYWDQGQPITLNGTGVDGEDGTLTKLIWISDRDGIIGHGNFTTSNLSAGVHNITLLVNDSIGQINATKIILILRDTKPPFLDIDFPPENKTFNRQNIMVKGIAYDDSGISSVTVNGIRAGKENWDTIVGLDEGKNIIEIVATDNEGFNATYYRTVHYNSSLAGDTKPPDVITNLTHRTGHDSTNRAWINWTWDNPRDEDFSHVIIYIDGIRMENTSRSYFTLDGLSSDADYSISILSADIVDNINYMEAGETVRTPPPDNIPPTTDIALSGKPGNGDWYLSDVEISLKAADDEFGTGVERVEYSFDDANWITYTVPLMINTEGTKEVYYRSTDNVGNVESKRNKAVKIDKTQPSISIRGVTEGSFYNSDVIPTLSISDTNLHTQSIALNDAPYVSGTSVSAENGYTLAAQATDIGGNKAYQAVSFTIDKTPPEAAIRFDTALKDIKVYDNETGGEIDYTGLQSKDNKGDDGDEKGWELRQYMLADKAGNSLVLVLKHKKEGKQVKIEVISAQYKDEAALNATENKMQAEYSEDKNGLLKELEQVIEAKKQFKAEAKYSANKNESEIKVKLDGQEEQKETVSGIATLELLTMKGSLKLKY